ncbi:hypothetical protein A7M79_07405 [Acinetobacter baumannii]|uniref:hypothetical protein n=1 Tax=Acinetobacter baumannii TaxID=470 RepID=UPI0008DEA309|nr:hypothetical protein [Acinetobacter baumannii]OIH08633.1 hypothetical protein A7M79_07405 [Acinetobacter baumannii]
MKEISKDMQKQLKNLPQENPRKVILLGGIFVILLIIMASDFLLTFLKFLTRYDLPVYSAINSVSSVLLYSAIACTALFTFVWLKSRKDGRDEGQSVVGEFNQAMRKASIEFSEVLPKFDEALKETQNRIDGLSQENTASKTTMTLKVDDIVWFRRRKCIITEINGDVILLNDYYGVLRCDVKPVIRVKSANNE